MHDCVQDVQVTMEIATWMRVGWGLGVGDGGFPMIYCDFGWGGGNIGYFGWDVCFGFREGRND